MNNAITDVPSIKVGHATEVLAQTGCTVILCEEGAVAGVDVRGSAPGTRETDAIRPMCLVQKAHAILLTGGSAFGLDAACGVMQYLEERGYGFPAGPVKVPIVPAAVIFDLNIGDPNVRPDRRMGYQACLNASDGGVVEGNVGAGTGATVGKYRGMKSSKGGLGTASLMLRGSAKDGDSDIVVGALVVVNALGNVIDPKTGKILAGARNPDTGEFVDIVEEMSIGSKFDPSLRSRAGYEFPNTTIGVIATNAALDKEGVTKVAQMAHDGLAMTIRPVHTLYDGDTIFALSTGSQRADLNTIGAVAAKVMSEAVLRAVRR
ncbi:TPA: peptidase S58 family protein [Candidatus Poribacteria bacterium]|nr:peptidase S58 family protein [Candidatus Poribacteria bacterium]